ncbi:hypothetical protein [Pseudomarimonas salicorniae]|uniref:Protein FliT n=1 Tax=Pseudomarimonas salicorniae TaxID=2933270 RepID=A0ABT0GKT8_9GAMM|nr:hypothetical protein [Lysobacter sp. CAU 1642]MCK7595156.1 hypothetical protein [Lysobacter sp. CAU 1642]
MQRLELIEAACREERWEDAETLMAEHDRSLRAVPADAWTAETLRELIGRQEQLASLMRGSRDEAAAELSQLGASKRGVQAYRK